MEGIDAQMLRDKGMMTNSQVSELFMVEIRRGSAKPHSRDRVSNEGIERQLPRGGF